MPDRRAPLARRAARAALGALLLLARPAAAAAQQPDTARAARAQPVAPPPAALGLVPGARVRIELSTFRDARIEGVIDSVLAQAFVLDTAARSGGLPFMDPGPELLEQYRLARVRYDEIGRLELSRGSSRWRGALIWGLVGGAALGTLTGLQDSPERNPDSRDFASAAVPGFIVGAVIGGALGYLTGRERWRHVAWP